MTAVDVVVVGGGPAGLASATTASRLGLSVVLFERTALGGGLALLETVDGVPGRRGVQGPDLAADLAEELLDAGAQVEYGEVTSVRPSAGGWSVDDTTWASALVLACGLVSDIDAIGGARPSLGRGLSLCSSCDGPLFRGQRVAVLGRGEQACRAALDVGRFAAEVYLLAEGPLTAAPATLAALAETPTVLVRTDVVVEQVVGPPVAAVRFVTGKGAEELVVTGVFVAGERTAAALPFAGATPEVGGRVPVGPTLTVDAEGPPLFAVGDLRQGSTQNVASAMGDGTQAAWTVARLLKGIIP